MSVRPYKKSNGEEVPGVWKIDFVRGIVELV